MPTDPHDPVTALGAEFPERAPKSAAEQILQNIAADPNIDPAFRAMVQTTEARKFINIAGSTAGMLPGARHAECAHHCMASSYTNDGTLTHCIHSCAQLMASQTPNLEKPSRAELLIQREKLIAAVKTLRASLGGMTDLVESFDEIIFSSKRPGWESKAIYDDEMQCAFKAMTAGATALAEAK